jgi:hypothetical protein
MPRRLSDFHRERLLMLTPSCVATYCILAVNALASTFMAVTPQGGVLPPEIASTAQQCGASTGPRPGNNRRSSRPIRWITPTPIACGGLARQGNASQATRSTTARPPNTTCSSLSLGRVSCPARPPNTTCSSLSLGRVSCPRALIGSGESIAGADDLPAASRPKFSTRAQAARIKASVKGSKS